MSEHLTDQDAKEIYQEFVEKHHPVLKRLKPTELDIELVQYAFEKGILNERGGK